MSDRAAADRLLPSLARRGAPGAVFAATCTFTAARAGRLSAIAAWFDAELCAGVHLTNAVGAPDTHWGRYMMPLHRSIAFQLA